MSRHHSTHSSESISSAGSDKTVLADERRALIYSDDNESAMKHIHNLPSLSYESKRTPLEPSNASSSMSNPFEPNQPSTNYATYPPSYQDTRERGKAELWEPTPMHIHFWLPLMLFLFVGACGLEFALYKNNKNQGWPVWSYFLTHPNVAHYTYTLPPSILAMIIVGMWRWTDLEMKRLQPYIDLIHGDSPPHLSLLLDYTRTNNFIVWKQAASNRHYLVMLASLMLLMALSFQPLAAAVFSIRYTLITEPNQTVNNLGAIGLNQDAQYFDLTSFLTAAGFASASVMYNLANPAYIYNDYTVAPFQMPQTSNLNGTVSLNTSAIQSVPGCEPQQEINQTVNADGSWTSSITDSDGCFVSWITNKSSQNQFGSDVLRCSENDSSPATWRPVLFWFFTYEPQIRTSATVCNPNIYLYDVHIEVDLTSGNITDLEVLGNFTSSSKFSDYAGNVTGPPLLGNAYNGIGFNLTNPDQFTIARENAVQLQLPAAVFQAADNNAQGVSEVFDDNEVVALSTQIYSTYLKLLASTVYFLPIETPMEVGLKTLQPRLWMSTAACHLLALAITILAFFGTIVHLFHRADRRDLKLAQPPGTIASAVSIGSQTYVGDILSGRKGEKEINEALRGKKFRIDPVTLKIVMYGEEGYESALTPNPRKSTFGSLAESRRSSRRFSSQSLAP